MNSVRRYYFPNRVLVGVVLISFISGLLLVEASPPANASAPHAVQEGAIEFAAGLSTKVGDRCNPDASREGKRDEVCANGVRFRGRGFNACLAKVNYSHAPIYARDECYGAGSDKTYAEAIAQARYVAYAEQSIRAAAGLPAQQDDRVSDYTQWELTYTTTALLQAFGVSAEDMRAAGLEEVGGRIDVVEVSRPTITSGEWDIDPSSNGMGIIELKRSDSSEFSDVKKQVGQYLIALQLMGFSGAYLTDTSTYADAFQTTTTCERPDGSTYTGTRDWTVTGDGPGVLAVNPVSSDPCDSRNGSGNSQGGTTTNVDVEADVEMNSADAYTFTVPAGSSVVAKFDVDYTTSGTGPVKWALTDSSAVVVASGTLTRDQNVTIPSLSGSYTLTVDRGPQQSIGPMRAAVTLQRS